MTPKEKSQVASPIHILLIEDDAGDATLTQAWLSQEPDFPCDLHWVSNLKEGIDYLSHNKTDAILLDLNLPDANGMDAFKQTMEKAPSAALLLLTGVENFTLGQEALKMGAQDHLIKSKIDSYGLTRALRNAIERKQVNESLVDAEKRAQESSKTKAAFLANISHEIRTPLNAIIGMADLLSRENMPPNQREYVKTFQKAGASLNNLMNDILDFSKLESGKVYLEEINFDFKSLFEEVIQLFQHTAQEKDIAISYNVAPRLDTFFNGDPHRLKQILTNLVSNALKFTEKGSVILSLSEGDKTSIENKNTSLLLEVKDTGIGIPEEKRNLIFEDFAQVDSSITRQYGGTGLGLAICKRLTEQMGGSINIQSTLGKGTTFSVHFTLKSSDPSFIPTPATTVVMSTNKNKGALNILVVDDVEDNRFLMKAYMKESGHHTDLAENGQEAIDKIQKNAYDLVFMDMQMPVMDGLTTTRKIRQWEEDTERIPLPIVALTAATLKEDIKESQEAGCNTHLAKPIKLKNIMNCIESLSHLLPTS